MSIDGTNKCYLIIQYLFIMKVKKLKPEEKDKMFRKKYVYFKTKPEVDARKLRNLNTVIFGLHEKSGEKLFEKFENFSGDDASTKGQILSFGGKEIRKLPDKERKIQFNYDGQLHNAWTTLFVSPPQYAVHSLSSTVREVRQRYQNAVRCFIVVFDANFVRFSSDVKHAMDKLEVLFLLFFFEWLLSKSSKIYLNEEISSNAVRWTVNETSERKYVSHIVT